MNARWLRLLCASALALTSLHAHAQYSWIDDKGSRVFSDRPPPPGTPAAKILKAPRGMEPLAAPASSSQAGNQTQAVPDWKKREADYRERGTRREKEEREADAKSRQEHAAQCTWARGAQQQLATARKLTRANKKGEQEFMSDEDRGREQQRVQGILADCR